MTEDEYRAIALSLPEATEGAHMGHADFRVRSKIFATLWADGVTAVLKLTPDQQALLLETGGEVYSPAKGAWGARGMTQVRLDKANADMLQGPLWWAWENTATKTMVRKYRGASDPE